MIRRTSLLLLLAFSSVSIAQPLYKWVEADGSITFSPKKPPAGITFDTIKGAVGAKIEAVPAALSPPVPAAALPKTASIKRSVETESSTAITSSAPEQQDIESERITTQALENASSDIAIQTTQQADSRKLTSVAASSKKSRCQDLRKRVVSLERRLKSRLAPEDMDNTVIHMARYQKSFDQHCEQ